MSFTIGQTIVVLIIYQSLVFIFSLLLMKETKPIFVKILLSTFLLIIGHFTYMFFEKSAIASGFYLGPFFGLIYGPLTFTYTKSLIVENINLNKQILHFTPALLSLIVLTALGTQAAGTMRILEFTIPVHYVSYQVAALSLISKYRARLLNTLSSFYKISLFWLEIIIYLQLLTILIVMLESYFQSFVNTNALIISIYILVLVLIHCFYHLGLKQVRLFKGFMEENILTINPKEYAIPEEQFNDYVSQLETYIKQEKPYLEFELSLQDLSSKLSISNRNLSHIINRKYGKNFYSFINHHRIERAKQILKETNKSVKEIMYDSGFSNKATFYSIFKKSTGQTPDQFRKSLKS